jgi:hypothetical protein
LSSLRRNLKSFIFLSKNLSTKIDLSKIIAKWGALGYPDLNFWLVFGLSLKKNTKSLNV